GLICAGGSRRGADLRNADVVTEDDENVGSLLLWLCRCRRAHDRRGDQRCQHTERADLDHASFSSVAAARYGPAAGPIYNRAVRLILPVSAHGTMGVSVLTAGALGSRPARVACTRDGKSQTLDVVHFCSVKDRFGSCVTSIARPYGNAQLYGRWRRALRGRQSGADLKPPQAAVVKSDGG